MSDASVKDDIAALRTVFDAVKDLPPTDQQRVLRWAADKLGLAASGQDEPSGEVVRPGPTQSRPDIRTFVESKSPGSDVQFAATVAYYYRFEAAADQRQDSISANDLQEACRQAGRRRLGNPRQTLWNATSIGVLDNVDKGRFAVNAVGENLVAMTLPRVNGGPPAAAPQRRPQRPAGSAAWANARKAKKA